MRKLRVRFAGKSCPVPRFTTHTLTIIIFFMNLFYAMDRNIYPSKVM